jgi:hypothetical protein
LDWRSSTAKENKEIFDICYRGCTTPTNLSTPRVVQERNNQFVLEWDTCQVNGADCEDCFYEVEITTDYNRKEKIYEPVYEPTITLYGEA